MKHRLWAAAAGEEVRCAVGCDSTGLAGRAVPRGVALTTQTPRGREWHGQADLLTLGCIWKFLMPHSPPGETEKLSANRVGSKGSK